MSWGEKSARWLRIWRTSLSVRRQAMAPASPQ